MTSTANRLATQIITAARVEDRHAVRRLVDECDADLLRDLVVNLANRPGPLNVDDSGPTIPTTEELVDLAVTAASHRFGTTAADIYSASRHQPDVEARQVVFYAIRLALRLSYPDLGNRFSKDHTSVMHSVAKVGETRRLRLIATQIATQLGWDRDVDKVAS